MNKLKLSISVFYSMGKVRSNNEDNYFINGSYCPKEKMNDEYQESIISQDAVQLFAVCDGMGGEQDGEIASFTATSHLDIIQNLKTLDNQTAIQEKIAEINKLVYDAASEKSTQGHCGTTLTALFISKKSYITINIGDSRIYRYRFGRLKQITKDHTEVQRMLDLGFLKPEDIKNHPKRHVITRSLGVSPEKGGVQATISTARKLRRGDRFILCSDGIYDMIDNDTMKKLLRNNSPVSAFAKAALDAGGHDNLTIILINVA